MTPDPKGMVNIGKCSHPGRLAEDVIGLDSFTYHRCQLLPHEVTVIFIGSFLPLLKPGDCGNEYKSGVRDSGAPFAHDHIQDQGHHW